MAEMVEPRLEERLGRSKAGTRPSADVHPAWLRLMHYCTELGHGEIEKLKIQDGLPMAAEVTTKKVKFSP
jgi:hypothetical protein